MKKRNFLKIACVLLTLVCILSLFGCSGLSDEEASARAAELLEASVLINRIYYGTGIPTDPNEVGQSTRKKADPAFLDAVGFSTLEELKALTREVYTSYCAEDVFFNVFEANILIEGSQARYEESNGFIYVNTAVEPTVADRVEFDMASIKITKKTGSLVYFTVDMKVYSPDGQKYQTLSAQQFSMRKENGVWLLDAPTYAVYDERR